MSNGRNSSDARVRQLLLRAEDALVAALAHISSSAALAARIDEHLAGLRAAREELTPDALSDAWAPLTRRQRQYAALVALGCTSEAIARELCVTTGTVNNMIATVLDCLKLKNRLQLVGWVTSDPLRREDLRAFQAQLLAEGEQSVMLGDAAD